MQKSKPKKKIHPSQQQRKPGKEHRMIQKPVFDSPALGTGKKLDGKVALISGGDSGIGRAVAVGFARQGADVAICFLQQEKQDAEETKMHVEKYGQRCLLLQGDLSREAHCKKVVERTVQVFKRLDILVNNASTHTEQERIEDIRREQLLDTFHVNVFSMFYLVKAAMKHLKEGSCIINTSSVTAYRGSGHLIDYAATKGAIISFTRSLASALTDRKIRVNAVAPGPVWTPLIVSTFKPKAIATFGSDSPMGRAAQPAEIAASYIFLASEESSFITGQVLHPNGGEIVNG
jgi:NAD(P)-dependent dehydrogenase (short-subunit alcohol dehydrogenase family)